MIDTRDNKKAQEALILCLIIDTFEKAGIIYNELTNLKFSVKFFLQVPRPEKDANWKSVLEEDYKRLLKTTEHALQSLKRNIYHLKRKYIEYLDRGQKDFMALIAMRACVQQKLNNIIKECRYLSQKLSQIKESSPKYLPTPPFVKRYGNSAIVEFYTKYANDILLNKFLKPFFSSDVKPSISTYWEFRQSDSIFFKEFRENPYLFLNTSYWFQELPIYIPFIVHEIGHWLIKSRFGGEVFKESVFQLEKGIGNFLSQIDIWWPMPKTIAEELLCDAIAMSCFNEAYIFSLFLHRFGHEYGTFIGESKEMEDICDPQSYVGEYIWPNPLSTSIRLGVLCDCYNEYVKENEEESSIISAIKGNLQRIYRDLKEAYQPYFAYIADNVTYFEKKFCEFCVDQLGKTFYRHKTLANKLKDLRRDVREQEEKENEIISILEQVLEINPKINEINRSSAQMLLVDSRFKYAKEKFGQLVAKTDQGKRKEILNDILEDPPPLGRYFRPISNIYPFCKSDNDILEKAKKIFKSSLELWELAFCKVRFDCKVASNQERKTLKISDICESIKNNSSTDQETFLVLSGIYNFVLLRKGFSTKSLPGSEKKQWPPDLTFPYYTVIHSLMELTLSKETKGAGTDDTTNPLPLSVLIQIKLQNRQEHLVDFLKELLSKIEKWPGKKRIFTSVGWEDVIVLVKNISLVQAFWIKAQLFEGFPDMVKRTETTILLDPNFNPGLPSENLENLGKNLDNGDITIYSTIRLETSRTLQRSGERASIKNFCKYCENNELGQKHGFEILDIIPGRFDLLIQWHYSEGFAKFLEHWRKLLDTEEFLEYVTDIQSSILIRKDKFLQLAKENSPPEHNKT